MMTTVGLQVVGLPGHDIVGLYMSLLWSDVATQWRRHEFECIGRCGVEYSEKTLTFENGGGACPPHATPPPKKNFLHA